MAAQAAVAAVRKGCEMLSQGKAEIGALKKTVEQGIGDAKAVYKEITGLWGWFKGLISGAPKAAPAPQLALQSPAAPQPVSVKPKKSKPAPEPELSYEEYQTRAIHQVCEQLKTFFEIRRTLKAHCHELEEVSKDTDNIESSAIDRVEIELQLENMTTQIREAMVYAPSELKDIYSRFLQMYGKIIEEQEFERLVRKKKTKRRRGAPMAATGQTNRNGGGNNRNGAAAPAGGGNSSGSAQSEYRTLQLLARVLVYLAIAIFVVTSFLAYIETKWMKAEIKQEARELYRLRSQVEGMLKERNEKTTAD
jgi:preprotein translocase subunit SecG